MEQSLQPLGEPVDFTGAQAPQRIKHRGRHVALRPLDPDRDAEPLYRASHAPTGDPTVWTYLPDGPYPDVQTYARALEQQAAGSDPLFFTVTDPETRAPLGTLSYLSIVPEHGLIEIGHIWFGPELKRTRAATEAIYLLAKHAFEDLGNRRLEWKCNALNQPSRDAAARFGFEFEGVFKNHRVFKGRNRDTAWFAITGERWPAVKAAFEAWLAPANFDQNGAQRSSLSKLRERRDAEAAAPTEAV